METKAFYKHQYEQMKKLVEMYQEQIVPELHKTIFDMEKNRVEVVYCKDCKRYDGFFCRKWSFASDDNGYCHRGERKDNG